MRSILVIDDEIHMLDAIKSTLENFGYHVETAINGSMGIELFETGCFELVILDLCLLDIDGFHVLSHIRRSVKKDTPVIGISGTPDLLSMGNFNAVLVKPFKTIRLLEAVISVS